MWAKGLTRDGTDLSTHRLVDTVRRAVWTDGHHAQDGQTLSRHLRTVLTEQVRWIHRRFPRHDLTP